MQLRKKKPAADEFDVGPVHLKRYVTHSVRAIQQPDESESFVLLAGCVYCRGDARAHK